MKRILSLALFIFIMLYNFALALEINYGGMIQTYTGPEITLMLNENKFTPSKEQMPPIIVENRTLVPVREVFEAFGSKVSWNEKTREVTVEYNKKKIKLGINNKKVYVNQKEIEIDVPAKIINNKTMVPVRFISENIGLDVTWKPDTCTVLVQAPSDKVMENGNDLTNQSEEKMILQQPDSRDYTYSWWPEGIGNTKEKPFCVQTGWYGMSIDSTDGTLTHLGAIKKEYNQEEALSQNFSIIKNLPTLNSDYSVVVNNEATTYTYTRQIDSVNKLIAQKRNMEEQKDNVANTRIIESGQYIQSFEAAAMRFESISGITNDFIGRVEYKATPEYLSIHFELYPERKMDNVSLLFGMNFDEKMVGVPFDNNRKIILKGKDAGIAVYLPNENASLYYDETRGNLTVLYTTNLEAKKFTGLNLILIPSTIPSENQIKKIEAMERIKITAIQTSENNGTVKNAETLKFGEKVNSYYDEENGIWTIDTNHMTMVRGADLEKIENRNAYDGVKFTIENTSSYDLKIPVMFLKEGIFAQEGFSPMLRDVKTKEPIGVPIQISKNWHNYDQYIASAQEWYRNLEGIWYHGYTYLKIPAGKKVSYEYINAFHQWGTLKLAHHTQLSLIGWYDYNRQSSSQVWNSSSLGSLGEAFCYDPDKTNGYDFIGDVRGTGFDAYGREPYGFIGWGSNNGGGNFLHYSQKGSDTIVDLKNVKVFYKNYGPNLTEVIYQGITEDNAVKITYKTYLGRTNDVTRATHTFTYQFLKNIDFERMAFYQIGGDNHNSGRWNGITIGNDEGPVTFKIDENYYGAEAKLPILNFPGYIGNGKMQRINVPGNGLWIAFTDSVKGITSDADTEYERENLKVANRMLSLLSFDATINGIHYTKPTISLRSTDMFCGKSTLAELGPAQEVGNTIKAGSIVKGTVEYINLPISKGSYYFDSSIIKDIPKEEFNSWKMAYRYALGDKTEVTAIRGKVKSQYPIKIECTTGELAAHIKVTGGISYIPLTFTNLPSYSGYVLQVLKEDKWVKVDQSVIGNDYWQAYYDTISEKYELTFNVEHSGSPFETYQYRLIKENSKISDIENLEEKEEYSYTPQQRVKAFWKDNTMYNETITMTERENGNITAKLLFIPDRIISVKDVYLQKEYKEGIDFEWIRGTNQIRWLTNSSIPYFKKGDLEANGITGTLATPDSKRRARVGDSNCLWCDGEFFYEKQISITYTYDISQAEEKILHADYQGNQLKNTMNKLKNNEDVKVLFYGDSIFYGYNASTIYQREPYMPVMCELIQTALQEQTSGKVTVDNLSVPGWTIENAKKALSGEMNATNVEIRDYSHSYQKKYDLMIISFGMNNNREPNKSGYQAEMKAIIDKIKMANPNLEVIVVSCMVPNPRAEGFIGEIVNHGTALKELANESKYSNFVAVVDMFAIHNRILQYKDYSATTGDNLRHPNDWLIRVYAQNILATILK